MNRDLFTYLTILSGILKDINSGVDNEETVEDAVICLFMFDQNMTRGIWYPNEDTIFDLGTLREFACKFYGLI